MAEKNVMAKIKEYKINGKFMQWQYWCEGCGYEHAFIPEVHIFNGDLNNPRVMPSLLQNFTPEKICHSFIFDGKISYLPDCWHKLAGQTVELLDIDEMQKKRQNGIRHKDIKGS